MTTTQYANNTFYSPTFHCSTSPSFYRDILSELETLAESLDNSKSTIREAVWNHLFILLGAKQITCSNKFSPIIKAWKESPTINLLAIELLYISISIVLEKPTMSDKQTVLPSNHSTPHTHQAPLLPILPPISPHEKKSSTSSIAPINFNQVRVTQVPLLPRSTPHKPPLPVHSPSPQQRKSPSPPTTSNSPLSTQVNRLPVRPMAQNVTPITLLPVKNDDLPKRTEESPKIDQGKLLTQLLDIQKWKNNLEQLPIDKKQHLLNTLRIINPNFPLENSFINIINTFAQSILDYHHYIECLHDVISLFLKNQTISFDQTSNSTSTLTSSSSTSSSTSSSSPLFSQYSNSPSPPSPPSSPTINQSSSSNLNSNAFCSIPILPNNNNNNNNNNSSNQLPRTNSLPNSLLPKSEEKLESNSVFHLSINHNQRGNVALQPRLTSPGVSKGIIPISLNIDDKYKRKISEIGDIESSNSPLKLQKK